MDVSRSITSSYPLVCLNSTESSIVSAEPILRDLPASIQPQFSPLSYPALPEYGVSLSPNQDTSNSPSTDVVDPDMGSWSFEYNHNNRGTMTSSHQKHVMRSPKLQAPAYSPRQNHYTVSNQADMSFRFIQSSTAAAREGVAVMPQTSPNHSSTYQYSDELNEASIHPASQVKDQQQPKSSTLLISAPTQNALFSAISQSRSDDVPDCHQTGYFTEQDADEVTVSGQGPCLSLIKAQNIHEFMSHATPMPLHSGSLTSSMSPSSTPMAFTPCHYNECHQSQQYQYRDYFSPNVPSTGVRSTSSFNAHQSKILSTPILSSQAYPPLASGSSSAAAIGAEIQYSQVPTSIMPTMNSNSHKQLDYTSSPLIASTLSAAFMYNCSVSGSTVSPISSPPGPFGSPTSSPDASRSSSYSGSPTARRDVTISTSLIDAMKAVRPRFTGSNGIKKRVNNTSASGIKKPNAAYTCQFPNCTRSFTRPFNLRSHDLTHRAVRPFRCDIKDCNKTFARIHDLQRHKKGHYGKAHICIVCQGRFARQDAVTRHLKLADGMNFCGLILGRHKINIRDVAAGRVRRSALGDEMAIQKMLEEMEEPVRRARFNKNMNVRPMNFNLTANMQLNMNMNMNMGMVALQQHHQQQQQLQQQQLQQQHQQRQYHQHHHPPSIGDILGTLRR
ncbi:hypothetical protein BGX27_003101 [Mortierella sp. AM989]|nr:hypothetical protein BGX27_003101 [Mortierella sp. AM989]